MGNHEIIDELGRGAMGQVFRARHVELGREVALKLIDPAAVTDEHARARFHREVKLLSELTHPNIVRIYDSGLYEGRPYFTMEILTGEDLAHVMARGPVPLEEVAAWMATAADALAYVHERGHTHRDIKPSNLMRTTEGRIVITDFGLVHVDGATVLTKAGELAGTPIYLAPEMLSGAEASPAQDVWALALTAHELVLGQAWVKAAGLRELILEITQVGVPPIESLKGDVPAWFADAQRQALHPDPAKRLSAAAYRDLLRARAAKRSGARARPRTSAGDTPVTGTAPIPSGPRTTPPSRVSRGWYVAAGAVLAALAIALRPAAPPPRAPGLALTASPAPIRRLDLTLSQDPPPGARLACATPAGLLATVDVTGRALALPDLPADTLLTLTLSDAAGAPLAEPLAVRTPPRARLRNFRVQSGDTSALVSFRLDAELPVVVEVGTWLPRRVVTTVEATAGPVPFVRLFTGLAPDTDHLVRVRPVGRFGGATDFRFRTWTRRWGDSYRRLAQSLTSSNIDEVSVLLDETPEAEGAAHLCRALEGVFIERLASIRHVAWMARDTVSRCVVDRLLPALDQDVAQGSKGVILQAALDCGHPDTFAKAEKLLPKLTENLARESVGIVLAHRGPPAFDTLVASYRERPEQGGILQSLGFADPERARDFFAEWIERPFTPAEEAPLRNVLAALAKGGIPDSARLLGRVLERRPRPWIERMTVDALVMLDTPAAAAVLVKAHAANPEAEHFEWGVVRAGADAARPTLRARLSNGPPAARRRAAFALGALIWANGAPAAEDRAVLTTALGHGDPLVASAAAWAFGQLASAHAGLALASRAEGGPTADPEGFAAWALGRLTAEPPAVLTSRVSALVARLAREPGDTAAALTRKALVAQAAVALGTAAGAGAATRARVMDALGTVPAPLRQAVEGGPPDRDVGPVILTFDLFPQLPALRLPLALTAGESLDLRGEGWLALPGGQLKIAAAAQSIPGELNDALTASLYAGPLHPRIKTKWERLCALSDGGWIASCYEGRDQPVRATPLAGATGWVRVSVTR